MFTTRIFSTGLYLNRENVHSVEYGSVIPFTREEKYYVIKMQDKYNKLNSDCEWKYAIGCYDIVITAGKTQYNFLCNQKEQLKENIIKMQRIITINELSTVDDRVKINYFIERLDEIKNRISSVNSKIFQYQNEMYGFLYHPLIECIKNCTRSHLKRKCETTACDWRSNGVWNLSRILISILKNCGDIKIGVASCNRFDHFERWNDDNIFAHPIIQMCDYSSDRICLSAPVASLYCAIDEAFYDVELAYTRVITRKIIKLVMISGVEMPKLFYSIYSINGPGYIIYSFLVGEKALVEMLKKLGLDLIKASRKRKNLN